VITLLATGEGVAGTGKGGHVEVRGNAGVRITAGPPLLLPTSSGVEPDDATNGVEIIVQDTQTVTIQRGVAKGFEQKIKMSPDLTVAGLIEIDASPFGSLTLKAGQSSITLDAKGITINGPLVKINCE
jgi:hypothetical protein